MTSLLTKESSHLIVRYLWLDWPLWNLELWFLQGTEGGKMDNQASSLRAGELFITCVDNKVRKLATNVKCTRSPRKKLAILSNLRTKDDPSGCQPNDRSGSIHRVVNPFRHLTNVYSTGNSNTLFIIHFTTAHVFTANHPLHGPSIRATNR